MEVSLSLPLSDDSLYGDTAYCGRKGTKRLHQESCDIKNISASTLKEAIDEITSIVKTLNHIFLAPKWLFCFHQYAEISEKNCCLGDKSHFKETFCYGVSQFTLAVSKSGSEQMLVLG